MNANSMASGWYYAAQGGPSAQPTGPLAWEQFYALAQAGTLTPYDLVWHETYPGWLPAAQVPGLFPAVAAPPMQAAYPRAAHSSGPRRSRLYWTVPLAVLVLAGAGLGAYFGLRGDGSTVNGNTSAVSRTTTSTTVATTPSGGEAQGVPTLSIGQAATVEQGQVSVSKITVTSDIASPEASALLYTGEVGEGQNASKTPGAGNEFLMITFMYVKDASYQYAGGVYPVDIKLVNQAGTEYRLVETTGYGGIFNSKPNEVAAGVEAYVTAAYEVPAGETGLTLIYKNGYADEFRAKIR